MQTASFKDWCCGWGEIWLWIQSEQTQQRRKSLNTLQHLAHILPIISHSWVNIFNKKKFPSFASNQRLKPEGKKSLYWLESLNFSINTNCTLTPKPDILAFLQVCSLNVRTSQKRLCLFHIFSFSLIVFFRSTSWSWRYKILEASSKSLPWGRWGCQQMRWWELSWAPNTRAPWTSEATSSLWRRRTSNRTRYQDSQTFQSVSFPGTSWRLIPLIYIFNWIHIFLFNPRCSLVKWVTGVRMWRPCQAWRAARRCSIQAAEDSEEPNDEASQLRTGKGKSSQQKYGIFIWRQNDLKAAGMKH